METLKNRKSDPNIIQQMIIFRKVIISAFRTLGREKIEPVYKGLSHIFHGERDRLIPAENSLHIQRALHNPHCCVHIMPTTGHTLNSDFKMEMPIRILGECLARG